MPQLRESMSMESRLKCAVNVRPVTITNLDGSNPIHFRIRLITIEYLDGGIGDFIISGNASENGQRKLSPFKTVGCIHDRYRLGHLYNYYLL
ncbi:hypothetical protein OOU_Y34scaffold01112g8 [Pyricularia oryzae Y34]|uniref:Uncharacterized protein n=1 Tax=Pyricularia oryzae (strain Y34) TaxID=1143189 RepID=A0AA97NLV4_PYRO3|nr:hypothetical protein OOU_Y34scaffold01112g8 [Pyricularia oryzae Y34]